MRIYKNAKRSDILAAIAANAPKRGCLIVPEQYSHEAERELAAQLGDNAGLFAEILTFSRLSTRVFAEVGGLGLPAPDGAAKILLMRFAFSAVERQLKTFGGSGARTEFLESLLAIHDEFASCQISAFALVNALTVRGGASGTLLAKLSDFALICDAYELALAERYIDPRDRLTRLADCISESSYTSGVTLYFEGFSDFTRQELDIIDRLTAADADIAVALTFRDDDDNLALPIETYFVLKEVADKNSALFETVDFTLQNEPPDEERLTPLTLYELPDKTAECEFAARQILAWLEANEELSPSEIGVAARGFGSGYEVLCRAVFARFGVPVTLNRKDDILRKAVMTLITGAFSVISGGWRHEQMFKYIKTDLTGIDAKSRDELENYCLLWNIRGASRWTASDPWEKNPRGYVSDDDSTAADTELLARVDSARRMVATPLLRLRDAGKTAKTAAEQAHAFYEYLEAIKLPETLDIKAAEFLADGEEKLAAEYVQLWEITVTALETVVDVLADTPMEQDEFGKLFTLLLAQYELATIPTMLHRVKLGDFDTLRETPLKCLIILGATDTAIPNVEPPPNLLSPDERRLLSEAGTPLLHDGERDLKREMYLFRKMLSKPSEQLVVTLPQGERVTYLLPQTDAEKLSPATDAYVSDDVQNAVAPEWSKLTADSVRALYGERLTLSATRIDKFNSCKLSYFLQFGLRANTRKIAEMNSLEFGNLAHFVLERVSRDVKLVGGFKVVSPEELRGFASAALDAYADERLRVDLESGRFKYLFSRLRNDVIKMVLYIAEELSQSNFIPQDFELKLPETDLGGMLLTGKIDRVDALTLGDTLYLRVADYKTGKTSFSLSDVYYGLGMQMLIYLYALTADNEGVKPGGVIYTPTSDILLSPNKSNSLNRNSSQQEIDEVRRKQLTGSGLVLNTLAPEAKKGLVTLEQLGSLTRHVERSLEKLGKELSTGGIDATPYIKGFSSNAKTSCDYCEYSAICGITKSDTAHKRKLYTLKDNEVWEKFCDNEQL